MTIKTFFAGMAVLALLLVNGCSARAKLVMEETGVLELPYTVQSLAWHPDGRLLAVGYFMRDVVEVWDVQTKKPVFSVPSKRSPPQSVGTRSAVQPGWQIHGRAGLPGHEERRAEVSKKL